MKRRPLSPPPAAADHEDESLFDDDLDQDDAPSAPELDENGYDRPSKSALKRASHDLQTLGQQLLNMPDSWLDEIEMPERLRDALAAYKTTRSFEGKRRQLQFIGKVIRGVDADPLREAVATFQLGHARDALALHEAESWRNRLLADEKQALGEWLGKYPDTDTQALRALIRQARKDQAESAATPPGQAPRHGRAFRELFQFIKQALKQAGDIEGHDSD